MHRPGSQFSVLVSDLHVIKLPFSKGRYTQYIMAVGRRVVYRGGWERGAGGLQEEEHIIKLSTQLTVLCLLLGSKPQRNA